MVGLEFARYTEHELAAGPGALEVDELLVKERVKVEKSLVLGRGQTLTTSELFGPDRKLGTLFLRFPSVLPPRPVDDGDKRPTPSLCPCATLSWLKAVLKLVWTAGHWSQR